MAEPGSVFVSYAHEDRPWADELARYLAPRIRERRLRLWDDHQIPPGTDWRAAIEKALAEATVSVLLVTQALLASEFVAEVEIPAILERAEREQTRLIWVAVNHSTVRQSPLWRYQAANDPDAPLESLSAAERARAWVKIADSVDKASTLSIVAAALAIIDDTTEPFKAVVRGRREDASRTYRVVASHEPSKGRIAFQGTTETITYEDLDKLPSGDRDFIHRLEVTMKALYERYWEVKQQIGLVGGEAQDIAGERELRRLGTLMCRDLVRILDFLRKIHKYALEDHYGDYRFLCDELGAAETG